MLKQSQLRPHWRVVVLSRISPSTPPPYPLPHRGGVGWGARVSVFSEGLKIKFSKGSRVSWMWQKVCGLSVVGCVYVCKCFVSQGRRNDCFGPGGRQHSAWICWAPPCVQRMQECIAGGKLILPSRTKNPIKERMRETRSLYCVLAPPRPTSLARILVEGNGQ